MWSQNNMAEVRQEQLGRWQAVLEAQTGINLKQHQHILTKGLKPWLQDMSEAEAEDALKQLEANPWHGLGGWLIDHLAVKETRFYRTPSAYRILARYLQKRLDLAAKNDDKLVLDMWSAGCSTGEEAYTMAMIASNLIEASSQQAYFGVIGSDVSNAAVKVARQGTYHVRRVQELPETLRERYMQPGQGLNYQVSPKLASRVCFIQSNLLDPKSTPRSAMDVIFCQNVLVYFRSWRQRQVLDSLVGRLKPGGILLIGPSEGAGWSHPDLGRRGGDNVQLFERRRDGKT